MHLGCFVASNLHVEMVETIVKSSRSENVWIVIIWAGAFASPPGKTHFRKNTSDTNIKPNILISSDLCEFRARTKFSSAYADIRAMLLALLYYIGLRDVTVVCVCCLPWEHHPGLLG